MSSELKELQRQRAKINERIDEIQTAEAEAISERLVGRCYRYQNNYSCPEKPSDYWWIYFKITGWDGAQVIGVSFERDKYGDFSIRPCNRVFNHMSGYEEISAEDFDAERVAFLDKLMGAMNK